MELWDVIWRILQIFFALIVLVFALGVQFIKPNEKSYIYRLNRPLRPTKQGRDFLWPVIDYLIKFPQQLQAIALVPEEVLIAGSKDYAEESQPIKVLITQPFLIDDIHKVYAKLGAKNNDQLITILFGREVEVVLDEQYVEMRRKGGQAGERIAAVVREHVASDDVKTLDEAYKMRVVLAQKITDKLNNEMPKDTYGIDWQPTIVADVIALPEVIKARSSKAVAAINRDSSVITAEATVIQANADAKAAVLRGGADAEVEKAKGLAQAEVGRVKGFADAEVEKAKGLFDVEVLTAQLNAKLKIVGESGKIESLADASKIIAFLLLGSDALGQLQKIGEFKFFMAPDLSNFLQGIFGRSKSVELGDIIKHISSLESDQKEKLKRTLSTILSGD